MLIVIVLSVVAPNNLIESLKKGMLKCKKCGGRTLNQLANSRTAFWSGLVGFGWFRLG
jgi:hypothetical protein